MADAGEKPTSWGSQLTGGAKVLYDLFFNEDGDAHVVKGEDKIVQEVGGIPTFDDKGEKTGTETQEFGEDDNSWHERVLYEKLLAWCIAKFHADTDPGSGMPFVESEDANLCLSGSELSSSNYYVASGDNRHLPNRLYDYFILCYRGKNTIESGTTSHTIAHYRQIAVSNSTTDVSLMLREGTGEIGQSIGWTKWTAISGGGSSIDDTTTSTSKVWSSSKTKEYVDTAETNAKSYADGVGENANTYTDNAVADKYEKPSTGIPKSDLAQSVQTSLGKADSALPNTTTHLSGDVPTTRKVNGKNLASDINLSASDVGAQETLVSGTNIKTVNNQSLLGAGNIEIQGGSSGVEITQAEYDELSEEEKMDGTERFVTDGLPIDIQIINDEVTQEETTWSSEKITEELSKASGTVCSVNNILPDDSKNVQIDEVVTKEEYDELVESGELDPDKYYLVRQQGYSFTDNVPVGSYCDLNTNVCPQGYLPCDGRLLSVADYPELYAVIGDEYTDRTLTTDTNQFRLPKFTNEPLVDTWYRTQDKLRPWHRRIIVAPTSASQQITVSDRDMGDIRDIKVQTWTSAWQFNSGMGMGWDDGSWKVGMMWNYSSTKRAITLNIGSSFVSQTFRIQIWVTLNSTTGLMEQPIYDTELTGYRYIKYTSNTMLLKEEIPLDDGLISDSNVWSAQKVNNELADIKDDLFSVSDRTQGCFSLVGTTSVTVPLSTSAYESFFACGVSANQGTWIGWGTVVNHKVYWNALAGSSYISVSMVDNYLVFSNPSSGNKISARGIICQHP